MDTTISFPTLLYPRTANSLCLRLGITLSVFGILILETLRGVSSVIPPMYFPSVSVLTTGKLFRALGTERLNSGIPLVNASMTSKMMDTLTGEQ